MAWVNVIGAGGALLGAMSSGDEQQQATEQKKTPWEPAQPWMKQNLESGQKLQGYMEQNPFNATQKQGYQSLLTGVDQFNQGIAPGLFGMANNLAGSSYSRQKGGAPGSGGGYGGAVQPGGMTQRSAGIFPTAPLQAQPYGQINWDAQNPFSKNNPNAIAGTPTPAAPAPAANPLESLTPDQLNKLLILLSGGNVGGLLNLDAGGGGPGASGSGNAGSGGTGGVGGGVGGTDGSGD